jgi:peptidoglycan biosynthesis protein MviN/MurJ (putative lipid II flippase)
VRAIGFEGLALSTSIAAMVNAALLLTLLRRRVGGLEGRRLLTTLAKVTVSSQLMAAAVVAIHNTIDRVVPGTRLTPQALRLVEAFGDAVEMVRSRVWKLLGK